MKFLEWTEEEIEDLVSNSNPFTILGVLIFCFIKDIVTVVWKLLYGLILVRILIVVLKGIRWILVPFYKQDDDTSAQDH